MWVVVALASLAVIIVLVLCVPLDLRLQVDVYGRLKFRMRLVWLFGLVSKEIRGRKKKPEEKKRVVEGKQNLRERVRRGGTIFKLMRTRGLLSQLKRLLADILGSLKIRDLRADFKVGLDNPADTGILFAFIGPGTLFLNSLTACEVRIQPVFESGAVLEGYSYGKLRLQPIRLVIPFLRFICSLVMIRVVKTLVSVKWKRKK